MSAARTRVLVYFHVTKILAFGPSVVRRPARNFCQYFGNFCQPIGIKICLPIDWHFCQHFGNINVCSAGVCTCVALFLGRKCMDATFLSHMHHGGFSIFLSFSAMNPPAESNQLLWLKDIEYNTHYKTCENLAKELKQFHFLRYFYVTCYNSSIAQPVVIKAASIDDHNALCKLGNKNSKDFQEFLGRIKYNSNGITEFQITEVCVCGKGTKAALLNKTFTAYCCDAFVSEFIKYSDAFR